ncbi:hypothetical protein DFR35_0847 [Sulfurisoma sediminicola]|uniref:Lipoprotein n=2 Tax=Sulfurisoma sediminicola TaxID=1381557 RepID=A0A497XQ84_9PROT|nr:hypothetical protein DFR35_0847 [Sulfurisoma sediminicola]
MRLRRALSCMTAVAPALLLGGCGLWPFGKPPSPAEPEQPRQAPRAEPRAEPRPLSERTRRYLASRGHEVIEERPLNVRADCSFRDELGYAGRLDLEVRDADVRRFAARVDVPRRGSCRFDLADFRQATSLPTITLTGAQSRCTVRMWEQGSKVTVAFSDCQAQCDGGTFDYLWPILVEAPSGRCF